MGCVCAFRAAVVWLATDKGVFAVLVFLIFALLRQDLEVRPSQSIVIEVVKGPSQGKVFRPKPNQYNLSVGRTKASAIHVKSPGVSEKHAEVRELS